MLRNSFAFITVTLLVAFLLLVSSSTTSATATRVGLCKTPPTGWNSWNKFACGVNSTILMEMADAMVRTNLSKLYRHINSDDCWMLSERDSVTQQQVPDPAKFPHGWAPVVQHIKSRGLHAGLYTARGFWTCQHRAASCGHEALDAKTYASWGIDYVKDDACSSCYSESPDETYKAMWDGLMATGKPFILTVESQPNITKMSRGGYGNALRVGHDITPYMQSMLSLIDIGSGLWPFAHNGSGAAHASSGCFFNDLDMIEIGNAPDFVCGQSQDAYERCKYHFSSWAIMKAVMLLGNDLRSIDSSTLSVVGNADAMAVNQDALGVQARRVAVKLPKNQSLIQGKSTGVLRLCDPKQASQKWHFIPADPQKSNGKLQGLGLLRTTDSTRGGGASGSTKVCLVKNDGVSYYGAAPCPANVSTADPRFLYNVSKLPSGGSCDSASDQCSLGFGMNMQIGASGPFPHSRYLSQGNIGNGVFSVSDPKALLNTSSAGSTITAVFSNEVINDNMVGHVVKGGGEFCVDVVPFGVVEVWAGPLTNGRIAVLVTNRSPGPDSITFDWKTIGASSANATYSIYDVWQHRVVGTFQRSWTESNLGPMRVKFYVLTKKN